MKALIGTGIGVLALGGMLFANAGRSTQAQGVAPTALAAQSQSRPTLVNCGEGRQAVIYNDAQNAGVSRVECVDAQPLAGAPVQVGYGLPVANQFAAPAIVGPTAPAERVVYRDRVVSRPATRSTRTYRSSAPTYRTASSNSVYDRPTQVRSWKKSAVIIGSAAGAGAGVGALTGGKKGALIGAAIGAGGGTIYEMNKK
jgi:hypothetical protein